MPIHVQAGGGTFGSAIRSAGEPLEYVYRRRRVAAEPRGSGHRWVTQVPPRPWIQQGGATCIIIDPAGFIVTNNHVVENASEVTIRLQDGRELLAEIRGRDPKTDLALLKVDAEDTLDRRQL